MLTQEAMRPYVLVLSNRTKASSGLLWNGPVEVERTVDSVEPLAASVLRALRDRLVPVEPGDLLFFPNAAPNHRAVEVDADPLFFPECGTCGWRI